MRRSVPLISIIIPAFNAEKYILASINSSLHQTYSNTEIIVIDDGSLDDTLEIAQSFRDNRLKVFSQPNRGASAARNAAFQASTGDYIQYLDADDLLAENKIEQQMRMVQRWGNEQVYSSAWGVFYDAVEQAEFSAISLWRNFDQPIDWLVEAWTKQIWMQPSAWLVPRRLIEKAGSWNESLSLHDDGEFFCRVLLQSQGIKFCEQAKSYYRKGIGDSLSSTFSEKAIKSHLKICELYESHLLSVENSARTRQACATNYMQFHFAHYPKYREYRNQAVEAAKRLGGAPLQPQGTELFHIIRKIAGWQIARKAEKFYYGNGLNRAAL